MSDSQQAEIEFSAVLAASVHDMKNSLCMLIQSLDTLAMQIAPENPDHGQELAKLHYEASRLNGDLLHLLALYRVEQNQLPLNIEEHFIEDLFDELLAKNELYIDSRGLEVQLDLEPGLAWYFDCDLIGSLLNDILINAMRYTKDTIAISVSDVEGMLQVKIEDNGGGYPQRMLEMQEKMQQYDARSGRTGLGLFFANIIAEAHQAGGKTGTITLQNGSPLGGSIFTLKLP